MLLIFLLTYLYLHHCISISLYLYLSMLSHNNGEFRIIKRISRDFLKLRVRRAR